MRSIFLLLLFFCSVAQAETGYRFVHPDGTVEFSDQPIPGGEEIKLRLAPAIKFAPVTPTLPPPDSRSKKVGAGNDAESAASITITSPGANETFWFDGSGISVSVSINPALKSGQQIAISLDGKVVASGTGSSFYLGEVFRGSHTLIAMVKNASGIVLFSSPPVSFYVRQHSAIKRPPPIEE